MKVAIPPTFNARTTFWQPHSSRYMQLPARHHVKSLLDSAYGRKKMLLYLMPGELLVVGLLSDCSPNRSCNLITTRMAPLTTVNKLSKKICFDSPSPNIVRSTITD